MSNGAPPRACLTDFGFMTMVFDPVQPMACSAQLDGGAMTFMSPELLVPQEFGRERAVPTTQADIYAFGLVIFQVSKPDCGVSRILIHPFPRCSQVKFHSAVFSSQLWDTP